MFSRICSVRSAPIDGKAGIVDREHTSVASPSRIECDRLRLEDRSQMEVVPGWHVEGYWQPRETWRSHCTYRQTQRLSLPVASLSSTIRSSVVVETA